MDRARARQQHDLGLGAARPGDVPGRPFFAAPDHRNAASRRVLAKCGFVEGLWFDEPGHHGGVDTVVGCTFNVATVSG